MKGAVLVLLLLATPARGAEPQNPWELYQAVAAGQIEFGSLTEEQKQQVLVIQEVFSSPPCPGDRAECLEACDEADDALTEFESNSQKLYSCARDSDFQDDCGGYWTRTRRAYSDYEDAVSAVRSECN